MSGNISFPLSLDLKEPRYIGLRLNISLQEIDYFTEHKERNVKPLTLIQNKNGRRKERIVFNPSKRYKQILRIINRKFLQKAKLPEGVLGGVIGKTIDQMAQVHCGKEAVFSIDLKDFYPNISSGRVFKFFRKTGCVASVAGILTDLVTLNGSLPQGYPTSPMLANLIAFELDLQHISICGQYQIRRTRWIDDIVFSGRTSALSSCIPKFVGAIRPHGFKIGNHKTSFTVRSNHPEAVGLDLAGNRPRLPEEVVNRVKKILYECRDSGPDVVQAAYECDAFGNQKNLHESLDGKIRRVESYKHADAEEMRKVFNSIQWQKLQT